MEEYTCQKQIAGKHFEKNNPTIVFIVLYPKEMGIYPTKYFKN